MTYSPVIRAWQACEGLNFEKVDFALHKGLKAYPDVWRVIWVSDVDVFSENLWQIDDRTWR